MTSICPTVHGVRGCRRGWQRMMAGSRLRILVAGMIAADAGQGGAAWAVLQYVLGFRQLGHHVCFVHPIAASKLRPGSVTFASSDASRRFARITKAFGLTESATLLLDGSTDTVGLSYASLRKIAQRTD